MDQGTTAEQLQAQHEADREQFLDEHPGLFDALVQAPTHETLFDLLCKFHDHGRLSAAQVALALLIGNEKHVDAPIGRVTIRGTVVSVKARKNDESALVNDRARRHAWRLMASAGIGAGETTWQRDARRGA